MRFSRNIVSVFSSIALLLSQSAMAETPQEMAANKKVIADRLLKIDARFKIIDFKPAAMEGFYSVQLDSGPKLYFSRSGDYFFEGNLYSINSGLIVNLTENENAVTRLGLMKELNLQEMIIFSPKPPVKTKAHIMVFTDVDCGYCQKLHQEVPILNAHGIEVRYLAFPRAGVGSPTYDKLVTAWCSANKQDALTRLKNNQNLPSLKCGNPVDKQYDLGKRMGINGTPAILLKDGTLIPGYKPAADLVKMLGV